jgi:Response regulator containing a CheY-like receiver domain and a GGDEF domain
MILCVMDDLMFSIKIQTAAKSIGGIDLFFERTPDMVLSRIREKQPSLVIFDLNSKRMNPLRAIGQMKADPDLVGIRTLGFVSHVDAETIAAARAVGIDQVLARSAFAAQLGDILTTA